MKTILYNPIFINPQAYYVFPRLTRYLQPDNESTAEPANYIGTIEVKVIAYGDTTLKRTYTNTDSIDLSEFKNTWVRISLFTKVGSCVLGEWKIGNMESDLPYIDPEVLASLKAVVIVGNKTNNDSDRAIVKNLVDPDNPFVISNAAYEGMSGYNGYPVVFGANETWKSLSSVYSYTSDVTSTTIHVTRVKNAGTGLIFSYVKKDGALTNIREIPAFRVTVKGLEGNSKFGYRYLATEDATEETLVYLGNGTHELSKSFTPTEALLDLTRNAWVGIFITPMVEGEVVFDCDITIEVLPEYEGAFVTDGINDLITSTKTVQEMLGGSNELTIVSMVHQVKDSANNVSFTNYIRGSANGYFRNIVNNYGKTGIYGYTSSDLMGLSVVNNILGDKNDYTSNGDNRDSIINGNFSVQGYSYNDGNNTGDFSSVAWRWTIIANKVLTTDQINQVIAYFNLDRTLKPDILCNTIKQGITNENHAEFGDRLIDFSGNGRDIQLNNIAWKGDSGIGKYEVDFLDSSIWTSSNSTITSSKIDCKNAISHIMLLYYHVGSKEYPDIPSFKVIKTGADIDYSYIDETGFPKSVKIVDGVNILPASHNTLYSGSSRFCGFGNPGMGNSVTITQIPSHAGGLCLDGVNDFGKVTGMPIYKDYTFIIDRQIISIGDTAGVVASKSEDSADATKHGAFIFEYLGAPDKISTWSFYKDNGQVANTDFTRGISYQSTYSYNGKDLTIGTSKDSDKLWLGTIRDNDTRFFNGAIYSLMSFPYSMSEFLIDRQLKKHKLGTLYPDMVEWRPIIKSNVEYASISYLLRIPGQGTVTPVIGQYYPILSTDTSLVVYVATNGVDEVANLTINGQEPTSSSIHVDGRFKFEFPFNNSPQKINITIDEYIRYEDIVQPYPSLFTLIDYDTEEVYSWGSKLKVGTKFKGNVINLLPNMYEWQGNALYNGEILNWGVKPGVVAKEMVFSWDMPFKYLIDNNEPKVILSPKLLSMPNSSYKILGYIPDISGHGNNGVIHNSAYVEGSGVNEDGSYQFDGVDDFVTIPTLSRGGKQVLMKVNWNTSNDAILYDQRNFEEGGHFSAFFAVMTSNSDSILAYSGRNTDGKTYIDGILNANITCGQLLNITHNITALAADNRPLGKGGVVIGASKMPAAYCKAAVYDFMLFDNISTDDKIKELNEYVGIEGNTEWRKTK